MDPIHANNETVSLKLSAYVIALITAIPGYNDTTLSAFLRLWIEERVEAEYELMGVQDALKRE